jgi:uncharacterized protein
MGSSVAARTGPFHPGEVEIQGVAGVREEAERLGRTISPFLTDSAARLMAKHRLAVAASLDADSRVWASLLTGPPGFLRPVDDRLLLVERLPHAADPLARNLRTRGAMGLLAIDFTSRRRLRFNGRGLLDPERGIFLAVDQVYGNCPKYIQARRLELGEDVPHPGVAQQSAALNIRQRSLIAAADTFFIASFHPGGGADASHRGGMPGFVKILNDRTLAFGDYPGNKMYNTLGNLVEQPRSGLLFLDFGTGSTLQLTGRARLDRNPGRVAAFRGALGVVVIFEVEEALETPGAGVRSRLLDYSPVNP